MDEEMRTAECPVVVRVLGQFAPEGCRQVQGLHRCLSSPRLICAWLTRDNRGAMI